MRRRHRCPPRRLPNSEIPKDWQALLPGTSGTTFYVGGNDAVVSVYDATRNTIVNEYNVDTPVAIMRRSRLLCCASPSGEVVLRDPYSLKAEHRLGAHMGAISDIDVSGNLLVTCGFSQRCVEPQRTVWAAPIHR